MSTAVWVAAMTETYELGSVRAAADPLGVRSAASRLAGYMFSPVTSRTTERAPESLLTAATDSTIGLIGNPRPFHHAFAGELRRQICAATTIFGIERC